MSAAENKEIIRKMGEAKCLDAMFQLTPHEVPGPTYGGANSDKVLTCIFEDPDGTLIQYDQRVD